MSAFLAGFFGWLLAGLAWLLAGLAWLLAGLAWLLAGLAWLLAGLVWLLAGFLAGLAWLVWLGSLFFPVFFSSPCRNAAAGHFASISRGHYFAATRLHAAF